MKLNQSAFKIDAQQWCQSIEAFIKATFADSHREGIVVSISGGLDSSVTAALCTRAIGKEKVIGLMLPERFGNPEAGYYGRMLAKHLDIRTVQFNISPILRGLGTLDLFLSAISGREFWKASVNKNLKKRGHSAGELYVDALKGTLDPARRKLIAKVSAKQRARLLAVYRFAEENNYIVAGSAHKTEQMVGLFVKYGIDDGADIMPLKNIFRSQTLQLAEYLGIPADIRHRSPNPDILPGITDKYIGYFGIDYLKVDLILLGLQERLPAAEIAAQIGISEQVVNQIQEIIRLSEFSRNHALAPIMA